MNIKALQFEFKRQGFRKLKASETAGNVRKRNAEIAHWSRALFETVHCFGSVMTRKKPLYHGISCKFLFSEFSTIFEMPTSLTTSQTIACNFATNNGIVLALKHAGQADDISLVFDVSVISDFTNEQGF